MIVCLSYHKHVTQQWLGVGGVGGGWFGGLFAINPSPVMYSLLARTGYFTGLTILGMPEFFGWKRYANILSFPFVPLCPFFFSLLVLQALVCVWILYGMYTSLSFDTSVDLVYGFILLCFCMGIFLRKLCLHWIEVLLSFTEFS